MAKEVRKGRQTPTHEFILPYSKTKGQEAIDLYNKTGRTAQEWQELLVFDILALNEDDLFVHTKFGLSVPRRNGKNEVVTMREMWGLVNGEHIAHTAHRATTSHMAFERLKGLLESAKIEITGSQRAKGSEQIVVQGGGRIDFRTRTSSGGLGEGYDLLVIDEAQEYQDSHESSLKYTVSSSKNPQTIMIGTPPTAVSSGTVFVKLRNNVFQGKQKNTGWAEWGVEKMTDVHDKNAWYETSPSLGTILTERVIEDEIGDDEVDFNIQRLGLWIQYNQKSVISEVEWKDLQVPVLPKLRGKLFVGIKYGQDNTNVAMSIACKTYTDKIFVETIDCQSTRNGNAWILKFLKNAYVQTVVIDGASGQTLLEDELTDAKIKVKPILPKAPEVISANSTFATNGIGKKQICHKGQPSLSNVVTNCEHRNIGSSGGFGYRSIKDGADIVLMDSMILAYWACSKSKEPKKQKIYY